MSKTIQVELPPKLLPVFAPRRGEVRYRAGYGGRGSGKSFSFALMAAIFGYAEPLRILCTREFQASIAESFYAEVKGAIKTYPWLESRYDIGEKYIRERNGTEFLFHGLRRNISSIKSLAKIDIVIVEEAEDVPETSWQQLIPTIRAPGSEIWVIWNPRQIGSPVDKRLVQTQPSRAVVAKLDYHDNPWFPRELEEERLDDLKRLDPNTYAHIWDGEYLQHSDSQILEDKLHVMEFEARPDEWHGPYYGLDFGFANDPTAALRCWVGGDRIYVDYEAGRTKLELDETTEHMVSAIPGIEEHVCRADSARPESISYLKRRGLPKITAVKKWPGSVEDGIKHLRSYSEIVVHPRCKNLIREMRLYSYKVDALTGDPLTTIVDAHNHWIDALRYAVQPMIKRKTWRAA